MVSDESWRFSFGSAASFASNRRTHRGVVRDPLHRIAGRFDPVDEGVEGDAIVGVVVQDVKRADLTLGVEADRDDRGRDEVDR